MSRASGRSLTAAALLLVALSGPIALAAPQTPAAPDPPEAALGPLEAVAEPPEAAAAAWETAPIWGGDVWSLLVHPHDPDLLLAGTSSGQVYRSSDGGEQWRHAGPFLPFRGWVVSALASDPRQPGRVWAGLRGLWGSGLVGVSEDFGETWEARGVGLEGTQIYALEMAPAAAGRAAGDGGVPPTLYAGTADGVWSSRDEGETWRRLTADIPEIAKVTSLHVPPGQPDTILAGTWRRTYKSTDAGRTWRGVFDGMFIDSEVFAMVPTGRPGEIWAPTCNWVYQSVDYGETWRRFVTGLDERRVTSFAALPQGRLLSGTVSGLYVSDDQGGSWRRKTSTDLSILSIAHHPGEPSRVFVGTEGAGVWVSNDGGDNFRPSSAGMTNIRIAATAEGGGELWVAVNHAGPASGLYGSRDGGRTFPLRSGPLPTVLDVAVSGVPEGAAPPRVWAATEKGLYERAEAGWIRVPELGERRVDGALAVGDRVVAWTSERIWERPGAGAGFFETAYRHGPPRSVAVAGDAVWVTDADGLYRVAKGENHAVASPVQPGRVSRLGEGLLYTGETGVWKRASPAAPWEPLSTEAARAIPTGDPAYPVLLLRGDDARLLGPSGASALRLHLSVPGAAVESAAIHAGKIFLGTRRYSLLSAPLPDRSAPAAEPPPAE